MTCEEAVEAIAGKPMRSTTVKCPQCGEFLSIILQVDGWDRCCGDSSSICEGAKKLLQGDEIPEGYRELDAAWQAADKDILTPFNEAIEDGAAQVMMSQRLAQIGYHPDDLAAYDSEELEMAYKKEFPLQEVER